MTAEWTLPPFLSEPPVGARDRLRQYFVDQLPDGSGPRYTGAMFDRLGCEARIAESPNAFTPLDIVAVSMLSVDVPAMASIRMLGADADLLTDLLTQIPPDLDLVDATTAHIGKGSPALALWRHVRSYRGVGRTKASKLLARKRPRLLPIQDSVVEAALHHEGDFWIALHAQLNADDRRMSQWLRNARTAAGVDNNVGELRIFDVLVWTWGKDLGF